MSPEVQQINQKAASEKTMTQHTVAATAL